ncbi:MAG: YkgJ family cysteine cluster protein [Planctomycetes bacterium]|nr:YkgJ family cysteine cluster protein [Planctomycetota bacterium]
MNALQGVVSSSPCARCAAHQKTCCQQAEILVTCGDEERIAAATGRTDVFEHRIPTDASYTAFDPEDPAWSFLTVEPDGTRRMLVRQENADCVFLTATGCSLHEDVRPLVCRLYPWQYTERGLSGEESEYCPREFLEAFSGMRALLGISADQAEAWRAALYRELREGRASS